MSTEFPRKLRQVQDRLQANNIRVDDDWISECVEYFFESDRNIGEQQLYDKSLEQWCLSDLADIGVACLPAEVTDPNCPPANLTGHYVVQMQFIIDVSESAYDQLQKLYNQQISLTDGEKQETKANAPKKKRSLKLELTDGHRTATAMEYRPIACLHTKLAPGCKILLSGPLRCVNRVLLLEPHNIRLLGGEVARLEVENAFENVLLRQLGRPLNPAPKTDYNEQRVVEEARDRHNLEALREQHRQSQLIKREQQATQQASMAATTSSMTAQSNRSGSADIFDDDDMLLADVNLDLDDEFVIPATVAPTVNAGRTSTTARTIETFVLSDEEDADDDYLLAAIPDSFEAIVQPAAPPVEQRPTLSNTRGRHANDASDFENNYAEEDDAHAFAAFEEQLLLEEENANEHEVRANPAGAQRQQPQIECRKTTTPLPSTPPPNILDSANYPYRIQGCNLVSIEQLQQLVAAERTAATAPQFIFKASVDSVFEKLQVRSHGWQIGVVLRDCGAANGTMRVRFGDVILNALSGTSAEELQQMRRQTAERPQTLETIATILDALKKQLEQLECFFKLPRMATSMTDADGGDDVPMIVDMVRSAPVLERIMASKMEAEAKMPDMPI